MQEAEVTPWFDGKLKPVRNGIYQRKPRSSHAEFWWSKWEDTHWNAVCELREFAERTTDHSIVQDLEWRGVCQKQS